MTTPTHRLVIIHDTDADGIAAAWAVNKQYSGKNIARPNQPPKTFSETVYLPQRAGIDELPDFEFNTTDVVYLVDRSYPWAILKHLSLYVNCVTVIDHHKTALEEYRKAYDHPDMTDSDTVLISASGNSINFTHNTLDSNIHIYIDTTHSACVLAWNFCSTVMRDQAEPITSLLQPWFIPYIEDRDLWQWKLPNSKEVNAGMHFKGFTIDSMDEWYTLPIHSDMFSLDEPTTIAENEAIKLKEIGEVVLQTRLNIIEGIAHGPTVRYDDWNMVVDHSCDEVQYRIATVCCPFTLISDLGSYMLNCTDEGFEKPNIVLVYNYDHQKNTYIYSLRSTMNVLWIAAMWHGGGHPHACGFSTNTRPPAVLHSIHYSKIAPQYVRDVNVIKA